MNKRKNILVLDVETAGNFGCPMVYDVGFIVADLYGNVKLKKSYIIRDVFYNRPELMEIAYYVGKVPTYHKEIAEGKHEVITFNALYQIINHLLARHNIQEVYAYNAGFDRRALNKTIEVLSWGDKKNFFPEGTIFKCIWSMACDTILQQKTFRKVAHEKEWYSPSGQFFSTNAETVYRYMTRKHDFTEEHQGLADAKIEYDILLHARRQKKKMNQNISPGCYHKVRV